MRYFKCVPGDFLLGTTGMPDNEFAAYVRIVLLMYEAQGPIPYDTHKLKLVLKKRPQDVAKVINSLREQGKLSVDACGMLHNQRVDAEIAEWRRNEASNSRHLSAISQPSEPQEGQKTEQKLRTRAPSRTRSLNLEEEQESLSERGNGSTSRRELSLTELVRRRRAQFEQDQQREQKSDDQTSD